MSFDRNALDRYITGNYGEDQWEEEEREADELLLEEGEEDQRREVEEAKKLTTKAEVEQAIRSILGI